MQSAASHHRTRAPAASAPLRTRPAQNLVFLGAGRLDIVCSATPVISRSARPRPSNRCQAPSPVLSPPVRILVGPLVQDSLDGTTPISTAQYGKAGQGRAGQHMADHDGIGETCGVSTMQQDLHIALHMRGSLDRRMLYVGVAHLVSSNFCPLLKAHARTRKVVRRSAQVVLGWIYPRYPPLPSPPTRQPPLPPCSTFASLLARGNSAHIPRYYAVCLLVLYAVLVALLGPYYRPSSLDRWVPQGRRTILCAPCGPLIIPFTRL